MPVEELKELGVARLSVPVGTVFAVTRGLRDYLSALKEHGVMPDRTDLVCTFDEFKKVVGLHRYNDLEKRFLPRDVVASKFGNR